MDALVKKERANMQNPEITIQVNLQIESLEAVFKLPLSEKADVEHFVSTLAEITASFKGCADSKERSHLLAAVDDALTRFRDTRFWRKSGE
jgi:hypothetical protein